MIVISMCLLGTNCTYAGKNNRFEYAVELFKAGKAIALCPEQLGGLTTPREPAERVGDRIVTVSGEDVTDAFEQGVEEAVKLAELAGGRQAILKARSPSCGCGNIYDGTFSHTLVKGDGLFAARLKELGYAVETEESVSS